MREFLGWTWLLGIAGLAAVGCIFILLVVSPAIVTGQTLPEIYTSHVHPLYGLASLIASVGVLIGSMRTLDRLPR